MQRCRLCHHKTKVFLDLGRVPLPEEFRTKKELANPIITYPLGLSYCTKCFHVQLTRPVAPDPIYKKNYYYDYSVTRTGKKHWEHLAKKLVKRQKLSSGDLVVDIGSNTGNLLSYFKKLHVKILGIDPANKLARIARAKGIPTLTTYFTPDLARGVVQKYGHASVITCTNVFDHVADLAQITRANRILLAPDGVLVIEVPYFYRMITRLTHIPYLQQNDYMMLTQIVSLLRKHSLKLVDAEEIPLHGGSVRMYIQHRGNESKRLNKFLIREQKIIKRYPRILNRFSDTILRQRDTLSDLIRTLKNKGKIVAAVGASAKGITLLNYCGLGPRDVAFITEKSPLKTGRFTPNGIPVVDDTFLVKIQPEYCILLSWNFAKEIKKNLTHYAGTWIIPVPKLQLTS